MSNLHSIRNRNDLSPIFYSAYLLPFELGLRDRDHELSDDRENSMGKANLLRVNCLIATGREIVP